MQEQNERVQNGEEEETEHTKSDKKITHTHKASQKTRSTTNHTHTHTEGLDTWPTRLCAAAKTFAERCPASGETFDVRRGTCNRIITHTRAQAQTRATHTLLYALVTMSAVCPLKTHTMRPRCSESNSRTTLASGSHGL